MNSLLEEEYRKGLRTLLAAKGSVVEIDKGERKSNPDWPQFWVSPYGWRNRQATDHIRKASDEEVSRYPDRYSRCELIIPEGVEIQELAYSEFQDSVSDNAETVGVNASGGPKGSETEIRCSCGKYRELTLRFEGSLYEALQSILGLDRKTFTL